jgi:glycosyltransferase involved in cell wall biosynthesis
MAAMDVLLVTARNEGGPQPVLEALACGVPVISTDVGFVPELRASLPQFVDIFEHTDEVPGLLGEARRKRERAQAGVLSIREALRQYTWQSCVKEIESRLQTVAGQRDATANID